MGLSPYSSPADAGVLCVILVNTAISISMVKDIVRSILKVIGIRVAAFGEEEYSATTSALSDVRGTPSESYMEELCHQTPAIRYDAMCAATGKPHHHQQECSVCLTEFAPDAVINRLPCGHVFHTACVEKWFQYWNFTCPLCRNRMILSP
ncbi:hypothetical protein DM860_009305 [Cuscuta australis]|uniref:RING-type domain-containing protein n=1 Tax=Cuscuta australis TaxID=267555 RepID=A0A328DE60_9ASTE|nr:hypothetical protein DM860_009305 [Cuscuta australis]